MSVQRAGTDIGALRELEVIPLMEAFRFKACVARQAQYVFDTFGRIRGTVPSVFIMNYVQAHHLDLDFYDRFFQPGAYLRTHAERMPRWHGGQQGG